MLFKYEKLFFHWGDAKIWESAQFQVSVVCERLLQHRCRSKIEREIPKWIVFLIWPTESSPGSSTSPQSSLEIGLRTFARATPKWRVFSQWTTTCSSMEPFSKRRWRSLRRLTTTERDSSFTFIDEASLTSPAKPTSPTTSTKLSTPMTNRPLQSLQSWANRKSENSTPNGKTSAEKQIRKSSSSSNSFHFEEKKE